MTAIPRQPVPTLRQQAQLRAFVQRRYPVPQYRDVQRLRVVQVPSQSVPARSLVSRAVEPLRAEFGVTWPAWVVLYAAFVAAGAWGVAICARAWMEVMP